MTEIDRLRDVLLAIVKTTGSSVGERRIREMARRGLGCDVPFKSRRTAQHNQEQPK